MKRWAGLSLALVTLAATGAALHADILVTRDGARVETQGPWKVQGRLIVFNLPNGTLSSMRTDQIDLEQSKLATARAAEAAREQPAAAPAKPASGEPVLRLTEKDIPPMTNPEGDEGSQSGSTEKAGSGATAPLEVVSWDKGVGPNGESVSIFGTIRNDGTTNIIGPSMMIAVYGEDGGLLATTDGRINQASIAPGQTANFRAEVPGLMDFTSIKFSLAGRGYEMRKPDLKNSAGAPSATGEAAATAEGTPPQGTAEEAPPPAATAESEYQQEPPADSASGEPPPVR